MKNSLFKKIISSAMAAFILFPASNSRVAADPPDTKHKVVFVGKEGVGKTSTFNRMCSNDFDRTYYATIGTDFHLYEKQEKMELK
jgi:GTPase SAR1 family protein